MKEKQTSAKLSEEELVKLLKRGDTKAFASLYDNYSAGLFGIILKIVDSEETAEDVLQETFVKIWKNIKSYDPSKGRLFTWLLNIARNNAIDKTRSKGYKTSQKVQKLDSIVYYGSNLTSALNIDLIGIKELVEKLKPEHREIINLLYLGGFTHTQAAEELDMPLGTVKTRIKIAIRELRKLVK